MYIKYKNNLGAEWLFSVNLSLHKNERTRLVKEFLKLVPMTEMEQQEIFVTLLRLLESRVIFYFVNLLFSFASKV